MFKFKVEAIKPIQIDIQNDEITPNYQQGLVLRQQYHLLDTFHRANEVLDQKAMGILQVGAFLVVLSGALSIPDYFIKDPSLLAKGLLAIGFLAFMVMVGLSITALSPAEREFPGSTSWDEIQIRYILADPGQCFNQMSSDLLKATESERSINDKKAKQMKRSALLLILQVGGLLAVVLVG